MRIEVEDAGPSIPPASVARIFEPFFTTKPRGTGLGLAIARNIARAQGGNFSSFYEPAGPCLLYPDDSFDTGEIRSFMSTA